MNSCSSIPSQTDSSQTEYIPSCFQLQWHLLDRCNLRCKHCYQDTYCTPDTKPEFFQNVLNQYIEALEYFCRHRGKKIPARITLTGGEPFLLPGFFDLLNQIVEFRKQYGKLFRWAILTNGTLLDDEMAQRLSRLRPEYVQVSLDGMQSVHDSIRSPGSFEKAVAGIRCLKKVGIRTVVSFTVSKLNQGEFLEVARLAKSLNVDRIWSDRLIPTCDELYSQRLSPAQTMAFFRTMKSAQQELALRCNPFLSWFYKPHRTEVAMNRALQFLEGGPMYRCTAGRTLVALLPDGTLLPCRRMPIPVGNLNSQSLLELYKTSDVFHRLRTEKPDCGQCPFSTSCSGGLRCLAYATTGNPLSGDPDCPIRLMTNVKK